MRRTGYLLCGLLAVPALIAGALGLSLYLARAPTPTPAPAAAPSAPGAAALPSAPGAAKRCGPAAACAESPTPIHVAIAQVPASVLARRPAPRPAPSPPASLGPAAAAASPPASQQGTPADDVLAVINQARSAAGLPPLTVTAGLVTSASAHTMTMADGCGPTHPVPG